MRVSRLAAVPRTRVAVGEEGLVAHLRPADTVVADGYAHLLRPVVVGAGVEHVVFAVVLDDGGTLSACLLPRIFGFEDGPVTHLPPLPAREVGVGRSLRHAYDLAFVVCRARGVVHEVAVADTGNLGIDGAAAGPRGGLRREDRVRGVALEVYAVRRPCVADGILLVVAVCLVEEVYRIVTHQGAGGAEAFRFVLSCGFHYRHGCPMRQVVALGYADSPALILGRRHRVVHQITLLETYDVGVFRDLAAVARRVGVVHGRQSGLRVGDGVGRGVFGVYAARDGCRERGGAENG